MSENVFFAVLAFTAVALTWAMFSTRQMMLGFPCAIFWAILGGLAYTKSVIDWDLHYLMFFASMGMTIFSVIAMYGLRTKKQEIADGDSFLDEPGVDDRYYDEGGSLVHFLDDGMNKQEAMTADADLSGAPFGKTRRVRARAERRRTKRVLRKRGDSFGEFD